MTYELAQIRDEIAAIAGPRAGAAFEDAALNENRNQIDDASDEEDPDWDSRGARNARRAAQIDAFEIDDADSDPEPHSPTRRRNGPGTAYEEYFGTDRRPVPPTGRGWENTTAIAAGERISNATYGLSTDAVRNTSLAEPEFTSAGPPPGMCASRRADAERRGAAAETQHGIRLGEQMRRLRERERVLEERLQRLLDRAHDALEAHKHTNVDLAEAELMSRITAFENADPAAYEQWKSHVALALACSKSKSRQYQIMQWYTRGVPGRVSRQLRRIDIWYTTLAHLEQEVLSSQVLLRAESQPDVHEHQKDDDVWAGKKRQHAFGYDVEHTVNGFQDYVPKGEGVALIKHFYANFDARKLRVQHASASEFGVLSQMLNRFVSRAMGVFDGLPRSSEQNSEFHSLARRTRATLRRYSSSPVMRQPESESSSSEEEMDVDDESDSSDGSEVFEIPSGILRAVRRMTTAGLTRAAMLDRNVVRGATRAVGGDEVSMSEEDDREEDDEESEDEDEEGDENTPPAVVAGGEEEEEEVDDDGDASMESGSS